MQILTCIDYRKTVGGEAHILTVCAGRREMSPLSVHVMSCTWRTAEELKQIWQKSHQPVRKCQLCNLDVSTACMRWLNVWVFGHMQSYVCISGCVYTCNWLSVVFVSVCSCMCVHVCACACWDCSKRRTCQHLPARGTIRGTVRRRRDYCVWEKETHSLQQSFCCLHVWFPLFQRAVEFSHGFGFALILCYSGELRLFVAH